MKEKNDEVHQYLIISGTSKSATTALFGYLSSHPQICASSAKETRFFLDKDYPLPSKYRYDEGVKKYFEFFTCENDEQVRLEATPDYMYSLNTDRKIRDTLQNVKLVFVLREPISRLLSWFKFGKLLRKIPKNMSFDEYVEFLIHNSKKSEKIYQHPAFYALEHGKYSDYLKSYVNIFGKKQIHICFFEDFRRNPVSFMKSICKFVNIDPNYYDRYFYEPTNQSFLMRSNYLHHIYVEIKNFLRTLVYEKKNVRYILKKLRYYLEPVYYKLNAKKNLEITVSNQTMNFLNKYYDQEANYLKKMFGVIPPW